MRNHRTTGWQSALCGIALGLSFTRNAAAQSDAPDAGEQGECMPSPHECAERCPTYDTCFISEGNGQLFYRVGSQRFDCNGLDCIPASMELGDYCCRRGEYAPSQDDGDDDDGGGCSFGGASPAAGAASAGFALLVLLARLARRRPRPARPDRGATRPA